MALSIIQFPAGPIETNAYLVVDDATMDAIVIDAPSGSVDLIAGGIARTGATVRSLVITHGHWDHIADTNGLARALNVPVYAHAAVVDRIANPADGFPVEIVPATVDHQLDEGDVVVVGSHSFTVMFLPGHDVGHIALYDVENQIFLGGDVLFPGGHGRTDIPGSDQAVMNQTIKRLLDLPDDVVVYPGHGDQTTIGAERRWMTRLAARV